MSFLDEFGPQKQEIFLKICILGVACIVAFSLRLFAVIRFESVIHEFDPYFNYRTTKYLAENGYYSFHNWFDDRAWYPLGRIIGGTIYPGLMVTSVIIHKLLHFISFTLHIREVCVFLAPLFSSFTVIATYLLTKECHSDAAGLIAGGLVAIVPGYISRSVAGSYDNEAIAIFCMIFTYYLWIKAVKTGTVKYGAAAALAYFYMVSSWGGYVFLINLIPLHVLGLLISGRYSHKIYVAYSTFYPLATLLSMQIPFVGFMPVSTSEHVGAFGVFGLIQLVSFGLWVRSKTTPEQFRHVLQTLFYGIFGIVSTLLILAVFLQKIAPFTGRFYSLLDPSYAKNNIPIIASVSEHQPTTWSSYYFDLQFLVFLFPVGLYYCFNDLNDANIFVIIYALTSIYFSGVMVRLMLVLAPIMCVMGGIALSSFLGNFFKNIQDDKKAPKLEQQPSKSTKDTKKDKTDTHPYKGVVGQLVIGVVLLMCASYVQHCVWVTSEAYSSPSIVLAARSSHGRVIFDDFREAYYWLRQNTHEDAKVMSWWDYGYQLSAMANRTVIVDNNTWNNTHISRVGQAMASTEDHAYEIIHELDVDYVLVIFGGVTGYSSDDINKFLWMVRIGGSTPEGHHIKEKDYYTKKGEYRVDKEGSQTLLNSLMYKMCYYRFGHFMTDGHRPPGFDRVRNAEIGNKDISFEHLEEAYTSEHWIVRIYRVKKPANRG